MNKSQVSQGAFLMALSTVAFIGYAVLFFILNFWGQGFELGVDALNGITRDQLMQYNPAVFYYISHLHIATAGFIAATGIAVYALSWYGVRQGHMWAWIGAVVSPVVGLAVALPMHWFNFFEHNWLLHLGPIYLATVIFVIGALMSLMGMKRK